RSVSITSWGIPKQSAWAVPRFAPRLISSRPQPPRGEITYARLYLLAADLRRRRKVSCGHSRGLGAGVYWTGRRTAEAARPSHYLLHQGTATRTPGQLMTLSDIGQCDRHKRAKRLRKSRGRTKKRRSHRSSDWKEV